MDKSKKKKILVISVAVVIVIAIIFFIFTIGKSDDSSTGEKSSSPGNAENLIIGKWELVGSSSCDFSDNTIRINEDETIEGVEDYNTYKYENLEGNEQLIFSGYGDSKRFDFKFNDSNQLEILEEGVSDSLTCTFSKSE